MKHTFLIGLSAAIIGGLGLFIGAGLGMPFQNTVIAVGGGFIAAVVNIGSPLARLGGFLIGLVLGVFYTAMTLGVLPGGRSIVGVGIALVIMLIVITLVSGLTADRIKAWSMLLGGLVFMSGFYSVLAAAPWTAAEQLPTSFFTILAMSAIGFLVVVPATLLPEKPKPAHVVSPQPSSVPPDEVAEDPKTPLHEILGGTK